MRDRYRLVGLRDDELLAGLAVLVRREHALLADLLAHLAELDQRRLFLDLGYPSLFAYCTDAIGLSKSAAGRRIAAARVCRKYPEAYARVARGELELSVLCEVSKYLNPQNATELFDACGCKSYERVEELLAVRFPKPDVRDLVRCKPQQQTLEPLSADRFGVHFTADGEFRDLLTEVRALASHRAPAGDLMTVMKRGLEAYRRELQKERFAVGCKPKRARSKRGIREAATRQNVGHAQGQGHREAAHSNRRTRHVPATVSRDVYTRDDGRCTFVSTDGRRCGATQFLEFDHAQPWARGGESTVENLRLRCRAHNQHSARLHFGGHYVDAAIARARSSPPERVEPPSSQVRQE
jgi:5-methylcytosine-specific restriction endonuclease McrA